MQRDTAFLAERILQALLACVLQISARMNAHAIELLPNLRSDSWKALHALLSKQSLSFLVLDTLLAVRLGMLCGNARKQLVRSDTNAASAACLLLHSLPEPSH